MLKSFLDIEDQCAADDVFFVPPAGTVVSYAGIVIENFKILLLDSRSKITSKAEYRQRMLVFDAAYDLKSSFAELLINDAKFNTTTNAKIFHSKQLTIKASDNSESLIDKFASYVRNASDSIRCEILIANIIDEPEYGVMNGKLYVVGKSDKQITRFIEYDDSSETLRIRSFGENIQDLVTHYLLSYFEAVGSDVAYDVNFKRDGNIDPQCTTVMKGKIATSEYKNYDISKLIDLFGREVVDLSEFSLASKAKPMLEIDFSSEADRLAKRAKFVASQHVED